MAASVTLQALGDPSRQAILDLLRSGERPVGDLVVHLGLSQPAVSKHLRVLREAGVVEVRPVGQQRRYRIRPQSLAELDQWLASYRDIWSSRLDLLAEHLDRGQGR
jgi:DNA-binding transcriptional ArsR family regulator